MLVQSTCSHAHITQRTALNGKYWCCVRVNVCEDSGNSFQKIYPNEIYGNGTVRRRTYNLSFIAYSQRQRIILLIQWPFSVYCIRAGIYFDVINPSALCIKFILLMMMMLMAPTDPMQQHISHRWRLNVQKTNAIVGLNWVWHVMWTKEFILRPQKICSKIAQFYNFPIFSIRQWVRLGDTTIAAIC